MTFQNERRQKHHQMMHQVQEKSTNLEVELDGDFAVFSSDATKRKTIYSVDNMKVIEDAFMKVRFSL